MFQATGAVILAIGIWTKAAPGSYDAFLGNKGYKTSANVMLAAGSVVMVVGFLGCCGAARESKCMLGWVSKRNNVGPVVRKKDSAIHG